MKKFLFSSFLLLGFINAWGQTVFSRAYHDISESVKPFLIQINGDLFFTTTRIDAAGFGLSNLYKYSNSGTLKFRNNTISFAPRLGYKTLDNKLLIKLGHQRSDIDGIVAERTKSRDAKDFAKADEIRKKLTMMQITVSDTPIGSFWEVIK